jgi:hypothetical protein
MTEQETTKAGEIRAAFAAARQQIEADPRYTGEAKADMVATARTAANRKLQAMHDEYIARVESERKRLERLLFAPPSLPLGATTSDRVARDASFRDALDRAGRTRPEQPDDLLDMLRRAQRSGDAIQARAALTVALDRNHVAAINAYTDENPREQRDVERLYELTHLQSSLGGTVAAAMAYAGV